MLIPSEPLLRLLALDERASEREILALVTREVVSLLGERGSCVLLEPTPRVVLVTSSPTAPEFPIDLGRYPEVRDALETGRAIGVGDVGADPRLASVRRLLPARLGAVVAVPLLVGERRIGVLLAQSATPRAFDPATLAAAEVLAGLAARLVEASFRERRLEALETARALARAGDPSVGGVYGASARGGSHGGAHGAVNGMPVGTPGGALASAGWGGAGDLLPDTLVLAADPRAAAALDPSRLLADAAAASRPRRVLVIDDEPTHAAIVEAVLGRRGYEVDIAGDADEGMREARDHTPDLILLDVLLPVVDGFTVAERLKSDERTRDVPILFLSACDDAGSRVRAIKLGASDYLPKPFYAPELLARVERSLGQVEARERLRAQANIDELTGLGNLRYLRERLALEASRASRYRTPLAVVMMDVDKLKEINDRHGHVAGSRVLAEVGRVLRDEIRDTDVAVRYGGDEFVVVLPHASAADAMHFAERVLDRLTAIDPTGMEPSPPRTTSSAPPPTTTPGETAIPTAAAALSAAGGQPRVTLSIGIAELDHATPQTLERLLEQADAAAYRAKRSGGHRAVAWQPPPTPPPGLHPVPGEA